MKKTAFPILQVFLPVIFLLLSIDGKAQMSSPSADDSGANQSYSFKPAEICSPPSCPANGRVAFVRSGDIFTTLGGEATNITNNAADNQSPDFSPDGTKIVFTTFRSGGGNEVFLMNVDGSNLIRLTNTTGFESAPSFSPDGAKIVFVRSQGGVNTISVINADGTNQISLTSGFTGVASPRYSPDGSKIVFAGRFSTGYYNVYTMNADGSNVAILPGQPDGGDIYYPSYSPDGTKLLFRHINNASFQTKIFLSNADGSNTAAIIQAQVVSSPINTPVFSPDGTKILYGEQYSITPVRLRVNEYTLDGGASRIYVDNAANPAWQPLRPAVPKTKFDFDGDGKADLAVFRPSNGVWYLNNSQNGFYAAQWGASVDTIAPGDYDGDGKADLAVFRKSADSTWYILQSSDNTYRGVQWGAPNNAQGIFFDKLVPGDYDGDGKTDLAFWRMTDFLSEPGRFYILQSSTNTARIQQWGSAFDTPPPAADYDGDGKADLTIRRGFTWYILQSQSNQPIAVRFGSTNDKAVPADYDGDGKADVAVFRPSNGVWYIQQSRDGFVGFQFGLATDLPVPADYDGDGKTDIAMFRDGIWYLQRSQLGFTGIAFGAATDKPIPGVVAPTVIK